MTDLYCYDAAFAPDLVKVKASGGIAVNGYLTGKYASTTTQPAQARAAGLGYVPTYEEGASELVGASSATGQAVGRKILAAFQAKSIPLDGTVAVYPSVDVFDGSPSNCNTAWQGIRDVIAGKISVRAYAEGAVIDALMKAGLLDGPGWLSASTGYPGYNPSDPNVCMVQLLKSPVASTDADHLITDPHALGAWWPDNSPYASTGVLMALTDQQQSDLYNRVMGFDAQRWYVTNPDGSLKQVAQGTAGAVPAHALDSLDGNYLVGLINTLASEVTALKSEVANIQTGAVDVNALAQAIAQHVKLAAD